MATTVAQSREWHGCSASAREYTSPRTLFPARISAIESEGATVSVVDGDYDAAVRRSAEDANEHCLVISDTSWPGYHQMPAWVIDGYSTIFWETQEQLTEANAAPLDAVFLPVGVGALSAAAVGYFKRAMLTCTRASWASSRSTPTACRRHCARTIWSQCRGPHDSIMVGLNRGTPSELAWPLLRQGLDAVISVEDDCAREGMRMLARADITAGETGAAVLGGLLALTEDSAAAAQLLA